jgi:RNA polymerase sigma-70 factor, ECF subfamily
MPDETTDLAPILAAAKGDGRAFALVFERLGGAAWSFARRRCRDAASAEDAVHAAFLRLFELARKGAYDPKRGSPRALLLRLVRNATVDARRRRKKEIEPPETFDPPEPDGGAAADLGADAAKVLASLPEPWRDALFLRIDQGLPYVEIAAALEATPAQVKTWIFRARAALAARLAPRNPLEGARRAL